MNIKLIYQSKIKPEMEHGRSRYAYGCRCWYCKEDNKTYVRNWRAEKKRKDAWEARYGEKRS